MAAMCVRLLLAVVGAGVVLPTPATGVRAGAWESAGDAVEAKQRTVVCLLNGVRRRHELPVLHDSRALRHAATGQARAMVAGRYLGHQLPGGPSLLTRVRAAGYLRRGSTWTLGEVIGWGPPEIATPRAMIRAWLRSSAHRSIVLARTFRDVGVGVALANGHDDPTVAYTVDFGARRFAGGTDAGHRPSQADDGCRNGGRTSDAGGRGQHARGRAGTDPAPPVRAS